MLIDDNYSEEKIFKEGWIASWIVVLVTLLLT